MELGALGSADASFLVVIRGSDDWLVVLAYRSGSRQHCRLSILVDTSGEVCMGLAGRFDAVFCVASYDGPVVWKVHVKRRDVDLPRP